MTGELTRPEQTILPAAKDGSLVEALAQLPEEEVWLQDLRSEQTRRAYRLDIRHFLAAFGIRSADELHRVDRAAVIFWREVMEREDARASTIRRRLSAFSSVFAHLVEHRVVDRNPVRDVKRPRINRRTGKTASFARKQARAILDAPGADTLQGLRDRAILSVGMQVGPRRAEIAHLAVKDFHQNQGFWSLRFLLKGGAENAVSINPQTAQRIIDYLEAAGHRDDRDGPLFRPVRGNQMVNDPERHLHPDQIDKLLRRYVKKALEFEHGFSGHSMRATFIKTALDNGAPLEDVQRDVGHADPSTTKLYDRRSHNPEKSASVFANY